MISGHARWLISRLSLLNAQCVITNSCFLKPTVKSTSVTSLIKNIITDATSRVVSPKSASQILLELSPEEDRTLRIIQMEYDVAFASGAKVPDVVTDDMWLTLLRECPTVTSRRGQMRFWWQKEFYRLRKAEKRERVAEREQQRLEDIERAKLEGLWKPPDNRIFIRLYDSQMNRFCNSKLVHALNFGQEVVFDMSFDDYMSKGEHQNLVNQLLFCLGMNKKQRDPFHMHFCNVDPNSVSMRKWNKHMDSLADNHDLITKSSQCYTELFDKNRLVYLTPHAPNYLEEFDSDAVYIIGAYVDKTTKQPLTLAKAKRQRLKMAKLPIDLYLRWGSSAHKNLTLNSVMGILLDIKHTGDWKYALRHIPARKVKTAQQREKERAYKMARYKTIYRDA